MSLAAQIEEWRRLRAELEAYAEQMKVQKKRLGNMKEAITKQLIDHGISEVVLHDSHVLQVRREVGGKAKKPDVIAHELDAYFASQKAKPEVRAKMVDDVLRIAFSKLEEPKAGLYLMPPQFANRIVQFKELQ